MPSFFRACMKMVYLQKNARKNVQKQTIILLLDVSYKNIWINLAIVGEK